MSKARDLFIFSTINHLVSFFFMLFLSHFVHEIAFQFYIRSLVYNFQAVSKRFEVSSLLIASIFNLHMAISCEEIESFKNDENFFLSSISSKTSAFLKNIQPLFAKFGSIVLVKKLLLPTDNDASEHYLVQTTNFTSELTLSAHIIWYHTKKSIY